ncbi:MAG: TrkH family potassium uptake protein [Candidatus Pacebacteria bacterium]|nr:TrkH family potassium uptake protein [Candidatus Paceibacterota bacterium]
MKSRIIDYCVGGIALLAFLLLLVEPTPLGQVYAVYLGYANLTVLLIFAADALFRFAFSADKLKHLRRQWFDAIVFVAFVQYVPGVQRTELFVILRQLVVVVVLVSRVRKTRKLFALLSTRPAQMLAASFLLAIGIGAVLLMLPMATVGPETTSLTDAVFTATSAVCVTGLIVQDTATYFTPFGQLVILALIQAGGLGIMTFSVSLALLFRRQMDVRQRVAMQDILDQESLASVRHLALFILLMTLVLEGIGWLALFLAWLGHAGSPLQAAYHALFHSVSAFCNAGFSTFSDSLAGFQSDLTTNLIVCVLIILGGAGFLVIRDLVEPFKYRKDLRIKRLRIQTKIVLSTSLLLIVLGGTFIYLLEARASLAGASTPERILISLFQSVTTRTAGFNTCSIASLSSAVLFLMIVLMFIGASPGSTGGGVKTTTVAVLFAAVWGQFRQRQRAELYRRSIPTDVIIKALSVLCLSLVVVVGFAVLLLYIEDKPFMAVLFETVSAFGTVGLSTGITPDLSTGGKIVVTVLMFIGRLGPLTVAYAFSRKRTPPKYEFADERVMIG